MSELERQAHDLVGRRLGDCVPVSATERQNVRTKGNVGHHLERYFGVARNSASGPDFAHLGTELKTVPMRRRRRGLVAKERTSITQINYAEIARQPFKNSPLDLKTRRTLYVFYEWERDRPTAETPLISVMLHERDTADTDMAVRAYEHVVARVLAGEAHLISEGDTLGIGAATKDAGGRWVPQPYGAERARRRAFAWKASYTTTLFTSRESDLASTATELDALLSDARLRAARHQGQTVGDLRDVYCPGTSDDWKSLTGAVSRRLLGSSRSRTEPRSYQRYGLLIRAVRLAGDGTPWEATSFPAIDFRDVAEEEWESSPLVEQLRSLLFVIYDDPAKRVVDARLRGLVHWQPTSADIATMKREYEMLRSYIAKSMPGDAPTESQTSILHLRPHGSDGSDKVVLPDGSRFRRSAFWLNRHYLRDVIGRASRAG